MLVGMWVHGRRLRGGAASPGPGRAGFLKISGDPDPDPIPDPDPDPGQRPLPSLKVTNGRF